MKNSILILLISLLALPGCQEHKAILSEEEKARINDEITGIVENFLSPEINVKTHIALRANTDGYIFGSDGVIMYENYNDYAEGVKTAFEGITKFISLKPVKSFVYVLSEDAASCTCEFKGQIVTIAGDTLTHNGCWTFVFKKLDSEWKVVQENGTHLRE